MAFFELNIAMSGLFAAQRGLQVTTNNITNASTKGYSRQVLSQKADTPLTGLGVGMTGTGVATTGVNRLRNSYLDTKIWNQNAKLGQYNIKVTQNSIIESVYGEPSDSGYTKVHDGLFSSLSTLSTDPTSNEGKIAVREKIISFSQYYNNIAAALEGYQKDLNLEIKTTVEEINSLGARIQSLNKQIFEAEMYGDEASSFRDERDLCIDRLSQIIDVEASENEVEVNGNTVKRFSVKIAGQPLVDHLSLNVLELQVRGETEGEIDRLVEQLKGQYDALKANPGDSTIQSKIAKLQAQLLKVDDGVKIATDGTVTFTNNKKEMITVLSLDAAGEAKTTTAGTGKYNEADVDGLYQITWSNGLDFDMTSNQLSGEIKGLIDMRDGCGTNAEVSYKGIAYYRERMDNYVRTFAKTINEEYSKDEQGRIIIEELTNRTLASGKNVASVGYVSHDGDENYTFYDQNGNEITGLSDEEKKELSGMYTTKYKLLSCATEDTKNTPTDGKELVGDYSAMTANDFTISLEIFSDVSQMRTTYDSSNPSDTSFMLNLLAQKDNRGMFKEGTPTDYMIGIFSELGINATEAKMYQSTQESVTNYLGQQRLSVSQVDTNEEFAYLIKYQQAYQAAAKVMNTIDGIYETTIFKLGNF